MSTVAVFGGSFNPPHLAHVLAVTVVLSTQDVDRVLVVPTYRHPFAKSLAPFEDRVRMCELAMGWLPHVSVSRVEEELGGESRTLRTLEHLHQAHPDWVMRLVLGSDLLLEAPRWHGFEEIVRLATPIVLGRAGAPTPESPPVVLPSLSSTEVREKIRAGHWDELGPWLPRNVLLYIRDRALYASD